MSSTSSNDPNSSANARRGAESDQRADAPGQFSFQESSSHREEGEEVEGGRGERITASEQRGEADPNPKFETNEGKVKEVIEDETHCTHVRTAATK